MRKVFYESRLAKWLLHFSNCSAISLFGFIFTTRSEEEASQTSLNHEGIHAEQYAEYFVAGGVISLILVFTTGSPWFLFIPFVAFYVLYLAEWVVRFFFSGSGGEAYYDISFEQEAYDNQSDAGYCENRNYFGNLRYLFRHKK